MCCLEEEKLFTGMLTITIVVTREGGNSACEISNDNLTTCDIVLVVFLVMFRG